MLKYRRAFSLIETAIVLGVMGIVLGGLWVAIGSVREKTRQSQVITDVAFVVQGVKDFFRNSALIADASGFRDSKRLTHYIIERGLIPPEMLRSRSLVAGAYLADHTAADSAWITANGTVGSFSVRSDVGDAGYQFQVEIKGLTKAVCLNLAPRLTVSGQGLAEPLTTLVTATTYARPVTPQEANVSCLNNSNNMITLTYRLRDNN